MPIQWSHSRLQTFEQCNKRFYHQYVVKDVKDTMHPSALWGNDVHKAIENYVRDGTPLPSNMGQYTPFAEIARSMPGVQAEVQMAVDSNWAPTDWFSPDAWGRGISDILAFEGDTAAVIDWKTGKYRGDTGQGAVNAILTFMHYPTINKVRTQFVYFTSGKVDDTTYKREDLAHIMAPTLQTIRRVETCADNGVWTPNPTGLCAYCPVTRCQYNRSMERSK